jgi:hypothetical protein
MVAAPVGCDLVSWSEARHGRHQGHGFAYMVCNESGFSGGCFDAAGAIPAVRLKGEVGGGNGGPCDCGNSDLVAA